MTVRSPYSDEVFADAMLKMGWVTSGCKSVCCAIITLNHNKRQPVPNDLITKHKFLFYIMVLVGIVDADWHRRIMRRMGRLTVRPHLHIYLHCPVDILMDKIKKRQSEDVNTRLLLIITKYIVP